MKNKKLWLVAALSFVFLALFALTACDSGEGRDSRLEGSWVSTVNDFRYELNRDGTGRRGTPGLMEDVLWSTNDNNTLILTIGYSEERWGYVIRRGNVYFTHPTSPGYEYPFTRP